MQTTSHGYDCACPCGETKFRAHSRPFARFYCHCLICQKLYAKPFADVSVVWARSIEPASASVVRTARHRRPPALDRSVCAVCGQPAYGMFMLGPLRTLAFVPSANFGSASGLPAPVAHIFYHRRTADIDDALPKYSGYWRSEFAVCALLSKNAIFGSHSR
jgi:hypothetical protein